MDNDDVQIGDLLSRREALALLGLAGGSLLLGCSPSSGQAAGEAQLASRGNMCVVRPRQTEGPYFVDERLNRGDVRSDPADGVIKAGVPLSLAFLVSRVGASECAPMAGAFVDIWQCDADGIYSDATDRNFSTVGKKFLRGYQITDSSGIARFTTIYPGWYPGRTVHIHFKVRTSLDARGYDFTSQVYFDDALTDTVFEKAPYAGRGPRTTRNTQDRIFQNSGGDQLILAVAPDADGYAAEFSLGLQV